MLLLITTLINKWVSMHHGTRKTNWQTKMVVTTDMQMEAWNFREETPFLPILLKHLKWEFYLLQEEWFFTTNCVSTETCQICLKFQSQEAKKGKRRTSKSHRQGQEETELIPNCQIFSSHSYKRNPWEDLSSHAGELVTMSTKPPSASLVSSPWSLSLPLSSSLLALLFLATNNVCVCVCILLCCFFSLLLVHWPPTMQQIKESSSALWSLLNSTFCFLWVVMAKRSFLSTPQKKDSMPKSRKLSSYPYNLQNCCFKSPFLLHICNCQVPTDSILLKFFIYITMTSTSLHELL